jgi:hypothetical protein
MITNSNGECRYLFKGINGEVKYVWAKNKREARKKIKLQIVALINN